ncbi:Predicted dehydrogenase [Sinosporangium album]|uniref:Predicted dehydrogenase n=1 Tax=Sinosporangium album TaxID=504805 RepID=A0A1G7TIV9_9ACTN|nr:Gfo/Idh/MocA family oxidoreductase [Sinosporangium album]SDG35195.1 Predicted dehydrogenase [Sinosporangium album]
MDEIRVGLVGYGVAGAFFHAPLIAAVPGLRLTGVVTRDADRAADARERYGARVVADPEELWEGSDLIVVASPNRTHVPLARAALTAGLPVVVDKPFAATAADAEELTLLARSRGLMLTVYQNRRWDGDFLTLRRLLAEGGLGELRRFESRFERWRPVPKGGWRETGGPEEVSGLLYDLGSHLVDQALWLAGPVREVYCETDVRRENVVSDDDTFVALTHASGARSHLWMSAVTPLPGPRFRVLGSRAAYVKHGLDVQEERLRAGHDPAAPEFGREPRERWGVVGTEGDSRTVPTEPGAYLDFYRGVVAALREGAPPPVDPEEAVATAAVIEAAHLSALESRVVHLT